MRLRYKMNQKSAQLQCGLLGAQRVDVRGLEGLQHRPAFDEFARVLNGGRARIRISLGSDIYQVGQLGIPSWDEPECCIGAHLLSNWFLLLLEYCS